MSRWLPHSLRGVCMGIADVIPGVSGGTLALILGIYSRLIAGLSAIGPRMLRNVLRGAFWRRLMAGLRDPDVLGDDDADGAPRGEVAAVLAPAAAAALGGRVRAGHQCTIIVVAAKRRLPRGGARGGHALRDCGRARWGNDANARRRS